MLRRLLSRLALVAALAATASTALAQPFDPRDGGPRPGGPAPNAPAPGGPAPGPHAGPAPAPHHWHPGYGPYRGDSEAWQWLAFAAITVHLLDLMNEQQRRAHEYAQIQATTAPIGQRIVWNDGGASGSVVALRDGTDSAGAYCREFQQDVTVGGRTEHAYGTACRQPDGAWKIVSTRN